MLLAAIYLHPKPFESKVHSRTSTQTTSSYFQTTSILLVAWVNKVSIASSMAVTNFQDVIKSKYDQSGYLKDFPYSVLLVYKNKASFDKKNALTENGQ